MASFCMERLLFVKKFTLYFRRLNFFLWGIVIVLLLQQVRCQKPPVYTAESCSNESVFWFFSYKVRTNCDPTKPYNKSLKKPRLLGLYGKVLPSVYIAQTLLLRRSVCTKTSGNTFPYRPRTRLISPKYIYIYISMFF